MSKRKSTTIKVRDLMRKNSGGFKISEKAWLEMKDRLEIFFELHMKDITKITESHGRRTVYDTDVLEYFGFVDRGDGFD